LLGREFTLIKDRGSFTWLFRFKHPVDELGGWLEELSKYNVLVHKINPVLSTLMPMHYTES